MSKKLKNISYTLLLVFLILILALNMMLVHNYETNHKTKEDKIAQKEHKEKYQLSELKEEIDEFIEEEDLDKDKICYYITDLVTDESISLHPNEDMTAGSIYKLPLAMLWYEMVNDGEYKLTDKLTLTADDYEEGSVIAANYTIGSRIKIDELLEEMIVNSDNTAAHMLFNEMGGYSKFKSKADKYSEIEMDNEFYSRSENIVTARYMNDVLNFLYNHSGDYTTLIKDMRKSQKEGYLNATVQTHAAQKYGAYMQASNAVGFVDSAKELYSIVVLTSYSDLGEGYIGDINEICYEYFNS